MNKHSEPLFQKSNVSPPGMIKFSNFITPSKTFQLSLGVAGKEILTLSALSRSCQFLPLSDRTICRFHHVNILSYSEFSARKIQICIKFDQAGKPVAHQVRVIDLLCYPLYSQGRN